MKNAIFAAAVSSLALISTAAHADTKFDAYVSAAAGFNSDQSAATNGSAIGGVTYDVRATAAVPVKGTSLGLQGDLEISGTSINNVAHWNDGTASSPTETVALHGFNRSDKGLVGVLFQATKVGSQFEGYGNRETRFYFGGEGQLYLNQVTLSGQATYFINSGSTVYYSALNSYGFNLAASAKYFVTPNTSVAAEAAFESENVGYDASYNNDHNSWLAGAKVEHRLTSTPISYTGEVTYRDGKYLDVNTNRDHDLRVMVGVKLNFGSKSLQERDRSGASLETVKPLNDSFNGAAFTNY